MCINYKSIVVFEYWRFWIKFRENVLSKKYLSLFFKPTQVTKNRLNKSPFVPIILGSAQLTLKSSSSIIIFSYTISKDLTVFLIFLFIHTQNFKKGKK